MASGKTAAGLLLMLLACALPVQAFSFEPISQEMSPSGRSSNKVFRAVNTGTERIAVTVSIRSRSILPDGTEVQGEDSPDFIIFPRQMILEPGELRSIRVKWTGNPEPASELSYRVIAEQLPVAFEPEEPIEGARIKLTYRYEGNIYIVPPGARDRVELSEIRQEDDPEGNLLVELENTGTRHSLLHEPVIKLKRNENDPEPVILSGEALDGLTGENMLAGSRRVFRIPKPRDLWTGPVYGSISYKPTY